MAQSSFLEYLLNEAMAEVPNLTYKRMFGGYGLYKSGIFFAIVTGNTLYFKVDESTKRQYQDLGSTPFSYKNKNKMVNTSYWEVPDSILEDQKKLLQWINEACKVYLRSKSC